MAQDFAAIADLPGFRRRFAIVPQAGAVTAALEDDIHCMAVTLSHDGAKVLAVAAEMDRAPWDTCPGAMETLQRSFCGVPLAAATQRGGKRQNCTHLYDLAELAARHALDSAPTHYEIMVADPVDGVVIAQLQCDDRQPVRWALDNDVLTEPAEIAGIPLGSLRDWIGTLQADQREEARLLQWACFVAHGRWIAWERQSDASLMPPNCHTFQPDRVAIAKRIGATRDFSSGERVPLAHFTGTSFSS